MLADLKTMRDVVFWLRSRDAEALLELREFEYAMFEVLRHLGHLGGASRELHAAIVALAAQERDSGRLKSLNALKEGAARLSSSLEQVGGAFKQIYGAQVSWGAASESSAQ